MRRIEEWHSFKYIRFKSSGKFYDEQYVALKVDTGYAEEDGRYHPNIYMPDVCEQLREQEEGAWLSAGGYITVTHTYGYPCLLKN